MTGTATACQFTTFIPMAIALLVVVILFGAFYLVRRRIRSQIEQSAQSEPEPETEQPTVKMEVTPVNEPGPQLAQEPAITSKTIATYSAPVSEVKPAGKRTVKKAAAEPKKESKPAKKEQKSQKAPKVTKGEKADKKSGKKPVKVEKKTAKPAKATKAADAGDVKIVVKTPSKKSSKKST